MLALHIALDTVEEPTRVRVWNDEVQAYTMGSLAAQWFSDFLGQKVRLVRFDPEQKRLSSRRWTGAIEAENAFSDGYPLLVTSTASLADLNQRLAAKGVPPVTMERFRPNLVLDGLQPYDEDHLDELTVATAEGPVRLKLVKPCGSRAVSWPSAPSAICPKPRNEGLDPRPGRPGWTDVDSDRRFFRGAVAGRGHEHQALLGSQR
jgi:uncharacterized protein YcbX